MVLTNHDFAISRKWSCSHHNNHSAINEVCCDVLWAAPQELSSLVQCGHKILVQYGYFGTVQIPGTAKPADCQKRATILGASRAKQSESLQCKFLWEPLLVPLTSRSIGQCTLTALGPILFSLPSAIETTPSVCAIVQGLVQCENQGVVQRGNHSLVNCGHHRKFWCSVDTKVCFSVNTTVWCSVNTTVCC